MFHDDLDPWQPVFREFHRERVNLISKTKPNKLTREMKTLDQIAQDWVRKYFGLNVTDIELIFLPFIPKDPTQSFHSFSRLLIHWFPLDLEEDPPFPAAVSLFSFRPEPEFSLIPLLLPQHLSSSFSSLAFLLFNFLSPSPSCTLFS